MERLEFELARDHGANGEYYDFTVVDESESFLAKVETEYTPQEESNEVIFKLVVDKELEMQGFVVLHQSIHEGIGAFPAYALFQVEKDRIGKIETMTGYWGFNPANGSLDVMLSSDKEYDIALGQWGYFEALSEGWDRHTHFFKTQGHLRAVSDKVYSLSDLDTLTPNAAASIARLMSEIIGLTVTRERNRKILEKLLLKSPEASPLGAIADDGRREGGSLRRTVNEVVAQLVRVARSCRAKLGDEHLNVKTAK